MNLQPLFDASLAVQIHVATVIPATLLGAYLLLGRKGTPKHRLLGRGWMVLMAITSLSSFFIHDLDQFHGFSLIHIVSVLTLVSIGCAIAFARAGNIRAHKITVRGMYFGGIFIAGGFTLLPGRLMNEVVFTGEPNWRLPLILAVIVAMLFLRRWLQLQRG